MGTAGLLLVGVVLLVNGLASLGVVPPRSAAPLNFFVGTAQVVLPTLVLVGAEGDPAVVNGAWPSLLFGITYLWFGFLTVFRIEPQGFGWYSAFVAAIAAYQAVAALGSDPVFAVIWATWAAMWGLFFVLMALGRTHVGTFDLGRFTGWFLVTLGIPTCTIPALLLFEGRWSTDPLAGVGALAALVALTLVSVALTRAGAPGGPAPAAEAAGTSADTSAGTSVGTSAGTGTLDEDRHAGRTADQVAV